MMSEINPTPSRENVGFLCRHGELRLDESKWDGWGKFQLSPEGREAAEKAGQWLSYNRLGRIIASDLPRTVQTAEIIMEFVTVSCTYLATDPNLRAWALGDDFTGKEKTPERKEKLQYYRDHPDEMIPNGGESWNQLVNRVKVAFQYLCTPYNALPTLLVLHNSVIKALMGLDEQGDVVSEGGIVAVFLNEKGEFEFEPVLGAVGAGAVVESSCG